MSNTLTAEPRRPTGRREWTQDQIRQRVSELGQWFHNMNLRGVWTAPNHFLGDYPAFKFKNFAHALPTDLTGKSVLDIGCNAGFYSLEMKRRGAQRVVAIDFDDQYLNQANFAAQVVGEEIEFHKMSVYEVGALREKFDLVIFMGVFYHLRHPLLALDLIHEHVAKDLFLFQSMQRGSEEVVELEDDYPFSERDIFNEPGYPKMHFIEKKYTGDPTNWWTPNRACTEALLRSSGFKILERAEEEVYLCRAVEGENGAVYPPKV
ncbi:MAG TPA: TIGR04290 family methyltransferase [Methylomirabilota bacterium]|nr:TIGR04290 family methyltransferase [Methylomirabilota bacterium]